MRSTANLGLGVKRWCSQCDCKKSNQGGKEVKLDPYRCRWICADCAAKHFPKEAP